MLCFQQLFFEVAEMFEVVDMFEMFQTFQKKLKIGREALNNFKIGAPEKFKTILKSLQSLDFRLFKFFTLLAVPGKGRQKLKTI